MLRPVYSNSLRAILPRARINLSNGFSSTSILSADQPNESLELDQSYRNLLRDIDISLIQDKHGHASAPQTRAAPRELEAFPIQLTEAEMVQGNEISVGDWDILPEDVDYHAGPREARKSPAAAYGSQGIGQVVLPSELQASITTLIEEADKSLLHSDAKRLFAAESEKEGRDDVWQTQYDMKKYKTLQQAGRHGVRDGTAFASVALPAHYAAIYSVLRHVKQRLERDWKVQRVIDWGTGAGSGLWASLHAFQKPENAEACISADNLQLRHSTILTYTGIDKREGLVTIAKRLLRNVDRGSLSALWKKSWDEDNKMSRTEGADAIALSAFTLSALPSAQARKVLVREMWESGAQVMVLIDHNTQTGFECIAEAREYLLKMGRKEFANPVAEETDIQGSHVVAPCPHDGTCPLYNPGASRIVCSFSQRLQRPSFVRLTKHSGVGHEDSRYSYVVIRRGVRPRPVAAVGTVGRIGAVGKSVLEKAAERSAMKELILSDDPVEDVTAGMKATDPGDDATTVVIETQSAEEMQETLRLEAFSWPRLVFSPMKRSGHVILDSCTAEGKVMRITIPKSQGKQPFYDARKASWGDIFPHAPKNPSQERYQPSVGKTSSANPKGDHIGKRGDKHKAAKTSYDALAEDIKKNQKKIRRERAKFASDDDSYP